MAPNPIPNTGFFSDAGDADNRQVVSDQQWEGFLEDTITVEFPAGLTVLDAYGQYTDFTAGNLIKEDTKVLIILVRLTPIPLPE